MMKILTVGGTYFLGKAFVELMNSETDAGVSVLHRGSNHSPLADKEILADRHDEEALRNIPHEEYDAIVDFCAYNKGDIEGLLNNLNCKCRQYIFISTVDVYMRGTGNAMNEDSELETRDFGGEAGAYISGKVSLESEVKRVCAERGMVYTVLRPAFIYGPGNYAPRESIYFKWIDGAGQIIHPTDADGEFQLVYVKDVARAIKTVIGNPKAENRAFNICENKTYSYGSYAELLRKATEKDFEMVEVGVSDVYEKGLPLPFPLTRQESNLYDGSRFIREFDFVYSDDENSMRETYNSFASL